MLRNSWTSTFSQDDSSIAENNASWLKVHFIWVKRLQGYTFFFLFSDPDIDFESPLELPQAPKICVETREKKNVTNFLHKIVIRRAMKDSFKLQRYVIVMGLND